MLFIHLSFCFVVRFKSSCHKTKGCLRWCPMRWDVPLMREEAGNAHFKFHSHFFTLLAYSNMFRACVFLPSHTGTFSTTFWYHSLCLRRVMQWLAAVWCRCIAVPARQAVLLLGLWGDLLLYCNNAQRCGRTRSLSFCMFAMMVWWMVKMVGQKFAITIGNKLSKVDRYRKHMEAYGRELYRVQFYSSLNYMLCITTW